MQQTQRISCLYYCIKGVNRMFEISKVYDIGLHIYGLIIRVCGENSFSFRKKCSLTTLFAYPDPLHYIYTLYMVCNSSGPKLHVPVQYINNVVYRVCNNPVPSLNGDYCFGDGEETLPCVALCKGKVS